MYTQILSLTFIQGIGLLATVAFLVLISFIVPQSEIGVYANLLAYLNIGVAVCGLGFEKLLIRDFRTQDGYDYSLFSAVLFLQVFAAVLAGILAAIVFPVIEGFIVPMFIVALLVTTVSRSFQRAIRLLGWPKASLSVDVLVIRSGMFLLGAFIWLGGKYMGGEAIFVVFSLLSILALIVYLFVYRLKHTNQNSLLASFNKGILSRKVFSSRYFWLNNIISVAAKEIDTIIAFNLLGASEAASFFFGRRIYNILSLVNEGASFNFEQDFSFIAGRKGRELKRLFTDLRVKVIILSLGLSAALGAAVYFAEYQFRVFENVFHIGLIFMLVRILENGIGPVFLYLDMRGQESYVLGMVSIFFVLKITLFFSIPNVTIFEMALIAGVTILGPSLFCLRRVRQMRIVT